MKIKTRESLKTIKTFDCADTLAQKSKSGISSLHNSAEQTQNVGYESETDYAGSELQDKEERIARMTVVGAKRVGRWGVKETRKNIQKWRNRPIKIRVESKIKQLPPPQRLMLEAPKTMKKATKSTAESVKTSVKVAKLVKKSSIAVAKYAKVAIKSIIAAVKAAAATVKAGVAAILAGGWIATLVIVIIILVALVAGSVYGIFVPPQNNEITLHSVMRELEREYDGKIEEIIEDSEYDILEYEGDLAPWSEVIAIYAVKLNLGEEPQEVATFNKKKADKLKKIFWDMNLLSSNVETEKRTVVEYEIDSNGDIVKVEKKVKVKVLTIITKNLSAKEISKKYNFSSKQRKILDELLSPECKELWTGILG